MERIKPERTLRHGVDDITRSVKLLKPLKLLLGITDDGRDALLLFVIDQAAELITGFCKISGLPERLYGTAVELAADIYRVKGYGRETAPDTVKSISEGGRSVAYADKTAEKDILSGYYHRLKPYINRRARLPSEVIRYE